jgi:hypothetical protein
MEKITDVEATVSELESLDFNLLNKIEVPEKVAKVEFVIALLELMKLELSAHEPNSQNSGTLKLDDLFLYFQADTVPKCKVILHRLLLRALKVKIKLYLIE